MESKKLNKYSCRRKKTFEVFDDRTVVKSQIVIEPKQNYKLFDACSSCGYGSIIDVLESKEVPFKTYQIKCCTMRRVD